MTVETIVSTIIDQLPNLAIALLMLYWQRKTIDDLLSHQRTLIDQLLQMVDVVSEGQAVRINRGDKSTMPPTASPDTIRNITTLTSVLVVILLVL